jgi:hypothetical protein
VLLCALASCDKPISNGFAVDVTVVPAATVAPSVTATVTALDVSVSGAETFHMAVPIGSQLTAGQAKFIYRPAVMSGSLTFAVVGLDASANAVLAGQGSVALSPGGTVLLTVTLTTSVAMPPDMMCAPETDTAFCMRLGKSCESFSGSDNCGQPRTVANCGSCGAPTSACVSNVCSAPVCADAAGNFAFPATGTVVASLHVAGVQQALLGISATGNSILFLRGNPQCVPSGSILELGEATGGSMSYTLTNISGLANLVSFTKVEETMTLTADGLTIIGVATGGNKLQSSSRSAVGMTDFGPPNATAFAAINGAIPAGGQIAWPFETADGLAFYFSVNSATTAAQNGIYESVRASTSVPFPAATRMTGAVQTFGAISGISADRMTAFMATNAFGTGILTRKSLSQPFATPTPAATPPGAAFRVVPLGNCAKVVGTCEPGGCANEDICVWAKQ